MNSIIGTIYICFACRDTVSINELYVLQETERQREKKRT